MVRSIPLARSVAVALFLLLVGPAARAADPQPPGTLNRCIGAWDGAGFAEMFPAEPLPEGAPPPGTVARTFNGIDRYFGKCFVTPFYSVLFYDLWFADNRLVGEAAQAPIYGAHKLDAHMQSFDGPDAYEQLITEQLGLLVAERDAGEAPDPLTAQRVVGRADGGGLLQVTDRSAWHSDVHLVLDEPVTLHAQGVEISVTSTDAGLVGTATGGTVDLAALGVNLGDATLVTEDPADIPLLEVPLPELAGFVVQVDPSGAVQRGAGPIPADRLPIVAGMTVADDIGRATVYATHPDGALWLRSEPTELDAPTIDNPRNLKVPFVVAWLVAGALFFTLRMAFVNLRMFTHAIAVTAGHYDNEDDEGEISHFQALSSALSATVGLGNISGVALAVAAGGPGAVFWMILAGLLGMSSKFTECTLGQMYRTVRPDGTVSGGPMHYLSEGVGGLMNGKGRALGYPLAWAFALLCVGASFGGGNMFQANQSFAALGSVAASLSPTLATPAAQFTMSVVYGVVLAAVVGMVILGGIKRIGTTAGLIVSLMCGLYLLAGVGVLLVNASEIPGAMLHIVTHAFTPKAGMGGLIGVLVVGFQRAAFSNEAGVGSASIAHSAAATAYPVREGIVALLEPFIDTVVVCTMTGLVVVVTGAYLQDTGDGVLMTSYAFGTAFSWFPYLLTVAVVLFAFSTMISWSYYGERCSVWLFGERARIPYKLIFLVFVVFGSVFKLGNVLDFSDLMVLGMAVPNVLGLVLLSSKVRAALNDYIQKLRAGAFKQSPPQPAK